MKKLIQGIVEFRKQLTEESRELFAQLALGVRPDTLFIACSDSRVVPNLFASTNPGDLFVLRNIGNLIPPCEHTISDGSVSAVLEFAVQILKVSEIVVCGHSECAAMRALLGSIDTPCCPHLDSWLVYGKKMSVSDASCDYLSCKNLSPHNALSQLNVLKQIEHILSYPFVKDRVDRGLLRIHGWWFDIAEASVYCFDTQDKKFTLIDEKEAERILKNL